MQRDMFEDTRTLTRSHAWFQLKCRAGCDRRWNYASDLYMCRFCQDVILCEGCRADVARGELKRGGICHPEHEWLYIPHWSNEYFRQVGWGNVRVGGTVGVGNYVEGGEVVNWRVWLNGVRREWGLPEIESWKVEEGVVVEKSKRLSVITDPVVLN